MPFCLSLGFDLCWPIFAVAHGSPSVSNVKKQTTITLLFK